MIPSRLPFQVIRDPSRMRALAEDARRDGLRVCVVPTMGYLHDGHLALLRAGRARADVVILTIFVNPTQFGPNEDLDRYPRDEAGDLAKARACGVDLAFCPDASSMYAPGHQSWVRVDGLTEPLCGASRPGHFEGVTTVVTKLFHLTWPHLAVFGEKDYQQLAVIRRMTADLDFGIEILGVPIVREADGLAMSSRNAYLSSDERAQALSLSKALRAARARFESGERAADAILAAARAVLDAAPLVRIDYLDLRDAETLAAVEHRVDRPAVLAIAAHVGATRLIDNTVLGS
jgi:pantoate--beta-alanine ligase